MTIYDDVRRLKEQLWALDRRIFLLENSQIAVSKREIDLPDHLYKTWHALKRGSATAEQVAKLTERARAVESGYLNQLVNLMIVQKERYGRQVIFSLASKDNTVNL